MQLPVLQPVVQDEDQVGEVLATAALYGSAGVEPVVPARRPLRRRPAVFTSLARSPTAGCRPRGAGGAGSPRTRDHPAVQLHRLDRAGRRGRRRWPPLDGLFSWPLFLGALFAAVLLHVGTNVVNEVYDVRKGIDPITSPRASHALVKGRVTEREALRPRRAWRSPWPRPSASG